MSGMRAVLLFCCVLGAAFVALVAERICRPGGRAAQWLGRHFCRLTLRLLRVDVIVSGTPPQGDMPVLLVANHVSWIDPLAFGAVVPACMLAKREVGAWPVIAALARLQATVLVDRRRRMRIPAVNRELAARLAAGRTVLLFPEGTTHDGARRGRFLTSHLACLGERISRKPATPAASAQAAAIVYSDPQAAWIGDATLLPHLWSVLRRPRMTCRVAFAPPVAVERGFDRKALGRRLAEDVEQLCSTPEGVRSPTPADLDRSRPQPAGGRADVPAAGLIMT